MYKTKADNIIGKSKLPGLKQSNHQSLINKTYKPIAGQFLKNCYVSDGANFSQNNSLLKYNQKPITGSLNETITYSKAVDKNGPQTPSTKKILSGSCDKKYRLKYDGLNSSSYKKDNNIFCNIKKKSIDLLGKELLRIEDGGHTKDYGYGKYDVTNYH